VFAADLLATAGDREGIGFLGIHIEQAGQVLDSAEHRPRVVDAAGTGAGVVVDAPAVWAHHRQVLLLLLGREGLEGLLTLLGVEPAAGPAAADAAPVQLLAHRPFS